MGLVDRDRLGSQQKVGTGTGSTVGKDEGDGRGGNRTTKLIKELLDGGGKNGFVLVDGDDLGVVGLWAFSLQWQHAATSSHVIGSRKIPLWSKAILLVIAIVFPNRDWVQVPSGRQFGRQISAFCLPARLTTMMQPILFPNHEIGYLNLLQHARPRARARHAERASRSPLSRIFSLALGQMLWRSLLRRSTSRYR